MRKNSLFIFFLFSFFLLSPVLVNAIRGISVVSDLNHQSGKLGAYRALIIGINDYIDPEIPDLETAVNDAKAMAEILRKRFGFQIRVLLNKEATKNSIYKALRSLASSTKQGESILIYYAGHGDFDRTYNDGWWIPVDAKAGDPITYLDNIQVQKSMRNMKARHVLLISDSCYSGTLFGRARSMPPVIDNKYYLNLYNEKSRWGMTSGNKTPVSDIGSGGHSVFAYQLLKVLRTTEKPYISVQDIYTKIAPIVANNSDQTPLCRPIRNTGDQGGEFVFVASGMSMTGIAADAKFTAKREQLEIKRRELERLKLEIEMEQLETERKRLEVQREQLGKKKVNSFTKQSKVRIITLNQKQSKLVKEYMEYPEYKALALALDDDGGWSVGYYKGAKSQKTANEKAMSGCNFYRDKNNLVSKCKFYAIGNKVVWEK